MISWFNWLAQIGPDDSGNGGAGQVVNEAAQDPQGNPFGISFWIPLLIAFAVMMLLMRPKKADPKARQRLSELKKNDRVVTAGGIVGTVIAIKEDSYVTLRIDESTNTKMQVLRSSISNVLDDEKAADKSG